MKSYAKLTAFLLAAACGGTTETPQAEEEDRRVALPAAPARGIQILAPELVFEPHSEAQKCWYTSMPVDTLSWAQTFNTYQGKGGHHVIVFVTKEDIADDTIADCTDAKRMKNWQLLLTPVSKTEGFSLPDGYGIKLEPGTKLVVQMHYINTSDKPIRVRDVINIDFHPESPNIVSVAPYAAGVTDYVIPANQTHTEKFECDVTKDMNGVMAFGHMHGFGSSLFVSAGPRGQTQGIYHVEKWQASFRDAPPLATWPFETPLALKAGDVFEVTCNWNNTSNKDLGFPDEMCAAVLFVYPADGMVTCSGSRL